MKKVLLSVTLVAAVAAGAAAWASSASTPRVLSLLEVTGRQHGLSGFHFQHPPRAGDQMAQTDVLYEWSGSKRAQVGRVQLVITSVTDFNRNGALGLLTAQVFLPTGSLFAEGYARFGGRSPAVTVPILGGTGSYADARGYVVSRFLDDQRTSLEVHPVG